MKRFGYNLTFGGAKCLSLTTGVQDDGASEFLINALGGPRVERHLHGFATVTPDGVVISAGARLKDGINTHLGPTVVLSHTTQEIARVRISQTPSGPRCELAQSIDGSWITTSPSTMGGPIKRRDVALPSGSTSGEAQYSISLYDARSGIPSHSSNQIALPFSAPTPFGIAIRRLP